MSALLLAARFLLAAVFGVAAIAKLADRSGARQAIVNMGLPHRAAPLLAVAVPLVEIAVAIGLIIEPNAYWSALAALGLLASFLILIGFNLLKGRHPDCHCFGRLRTQPIGLLTVARNAALASVAVSIWIDSPAGALLSMVAGAALLGFEASRSTIPRADDAPKPDHSRLPTGLPKGTLAPPFALHDLNGVIVSLDDLLHIGRPIVLFFLDPGCGDCSRLLPDIEAWQREHGSRITFVIVSRGALERNRIKFSSAALPRVLVQTNDEVGNSYDAWVQPSAVFVKADGRIGGRLFLGSSDVKRLIFGLLAAIEKARAKSEAALIAQTSAASIQSDTASIPHVSALR